MQEIIIDEYFSSLLPPLDSETFARLEESLLQYGCQNPLVLWDGILIDGHNRYEIIKKHDLPYSTVTMDFDSRDNVVIWIISTQIARRNLTAIQLSYYRGLHYNTEKKLVGNANLKTQQNQGVVQLPHNEVIGKIGSTSSRLSEKYNVSRATIERDSQVAEAITAIGKTSPDAKRDILAGKARISRKKLRELSAGPEEAVIETAAKIEEGTFTSKSPDDSKQKEAKLPAGAVNSEMLPLEKEFSGITGEFSRELRILELSGDTEALRLAFRSYIETLEDMLSLI